VDDPIASWWKAFQKQAPRIDGLFRRGEEWDLPAWMNEHLGAIHPALMWEYGPAVKGTGHRLVITPESRRELRPLVREILSCAPRIDGWEFYEYRLAEEMEQAAHTVAGRTGGDLKHLRVQVQPGVFNRVDLAFQFSPPEADEQHALEVAFVSAESLLGEEVLDRWIGSIDVTSTPLEGIDLIEMETFQPTVMQVISEIQTTLPDRPWHEIDLESGTGWSAIEFEPEQTDDYPEQRDLLVGITPLPAMWQNAYSNAPFDSRRYSKFAERFCYLKIDGSEGLENSAYADRAEIEDAINAVLRPARLGRVVGGWTGLRYSYIELALTNVARAWDEMAPVLRDGGLSPRTWLLFHDDELRSEYFGLYEESPLPPAPPDE